MLVFLLAGSIAIAGCTGYAPSGTPVRTGAPGGESVTIQNFVFSPPNLTVDRGTTVTWNNKDTVNHQVTSDDPALNAKGMGFSSPVIPAGGTYTVMFGTPGTFTYHCNLHPLMKGTIIVVG